MLIQECWGVVGAGALVYAPTPTFCCDKKAKKNLTTKNKMRQKINIEVKYYTRGGGSEKAKKGLIMYLNSPLSLKGSIR